MTFTEKLFAMNPWKEPEPINVCDDRIPCLFGLLLKQKHDFINSHIRDFAATYGYKLNKYHVIIIWLFALWATKILTILFISMTYAIARRVVNGLYGGLTALIKTAFWVIKFAIYKLFEDIKTQIDKVFNSLKQLMETAFQLKKTTFSILFNCAYVALKFIATSFISLINANIRTAFLKALGDLTRLIREYFNFGKKDETVQIQLEISNDSGIENVMNDKTR